MAIDTLPYLDETGAPFATTEDYGDALSRQDLSDLRSYHAARKFYIPPWPGAQLNHHHVADFSRPVTIHKEAFADHARVVARVDYPAWVLLHSCFVRFLCRDDGRFD